MPVRGLVDLLQRAKLFLLTAALNFSAVKAVFRLSPRLDLHKPQDDNSMPDDGSLILSDLRAPTLSIACEPCVSAPNAMDRPPLSCFKRSGYLGDAIVKILVNARGGGEVNGAGRRIRF
jgi:hypothetical protein